MCRNNNEFDEAMAKKVLIERAIADGCPVLQSYQAI